MKVRHYQRMDDGAVFSMEKVFGAVRGALPSEVTTEVWRCPCTSRGVFRRLWNTVEAAFHQGDINHVVGDVQYLALGLRKRRTILTIHDCVSLRLKQGFRRSVILWLWYRLPIRHVAAVTVISDFTRDEVLRYTGCDPSILRVIPDPVSANFTPQPRRFNAARPVLLQVGTAAHNKNLIRVAEALRGIPCRLEIIGRVTEEQRMALETNGISYRNQAMLTDREVLERYRDCDLVVFASIYEGFGMPIVEAHATGRPVVTSDLEPMRSVAGGAACLVDPYDCNSIREGILRVIRDKAYRDELVARGFENVKRFQADGIAAQYAAVYHEVASGRV